MQENKDSQANLYQDLGGISRDVKQLERERKSPETGYAGNFSFHALQLQMGRKTRNWGLGLGRSLCHKPTEFSTTTYSKNYAKNWHISLTVEKWWC